MLEFKIRITIDTVPDDVRAFIKLLAVAAEEDGADVVEAEADVDTVFVVIAVNDEEDEVWGGLSLRFSFLASFFSCHDEGGGGGGVGVN